jgi:hypothetical protein
MYNGTMILKEIEKLSCNVNCNELHYFHDDGDKVSGSITTYYFLGN